MISLKLGYMVYIAERFWTHADVKDADECWLWRGATQRGYGAVRLTLPGGMRRQVNANRVAFTIAYGPIETTDHVMHSCDTPLCVNPAHLFIGSRADNMKDAASKGRMQGHPGYPRLTPEQRRGVESALRQGKPIRTIAREVGTTPVTVRRYRSKLAAPSDVG